MNTGKQLYNTNLNKKKHQLTLGVILAYQFLHIFIGKDTKGWSLVASSLAELC